MNFLSHYYFDRDTTNCYHILGTVLPDLLKNADKTIIIHPEKLHHPEPAVNDIIIGWRKHLEVDRYFHSSDFFVTRSHQLKNLLLLAIEGSQVKPFFLGHIALELILDNLLITTGKVSVGSFYDHLNSCQNEIINEFLNFSGLKDTEAFFKFYEKFKNSRYVESYVNTRQIAYALKRICMRVWDNPFTPEQEEKMNWVLAAYRDGLCDDFMQIFDEINDLLNKKQ
ncbi:MAG: ACP phosphodiesterase [Mucilaginibacter sp.]